MGLFVSQAETKAAEAKAQAKKDMNIVAAQKSADAVQRQAARIRKDAKV